MDFSHFNESGRARMVNVSDKKETHRTAIAAGRVLVLSLIHISEPTRH